MTTTTEAQIQALADAAINAESEATADAISGPTEDAALSAEKAKAARAALASALAEVVKDAERYRWLTETLGDTPHGKPSLSAAWDDDIDDWRSARFFGLRDEADVDAAIDAALAARSAEQKGV